MKYYASIFKVCFILLLISRSFYSEAQELKPVAKKIKDKKDAGILFRQISLFEIYDSIPSINYEKVVGTYDLLKLDHNKIEDLFRINPKNISFEIPTKYSTLIVELSIINFLTPDFSIQSSSGDLKSGNYDLGLHYQGIVKGENNSVCAISIFRNEVMGFIAIPGRGTINLGRLENDPNNIHIIYNDRNLVPKPEVNCFTDGDSGHYNDLDLIKKMQVNVNCIRLYWEINNDIFVDKGSIATTTNYAVGLFNQSSALFANDNIPVELSSLFIWDTPSPYTSNNARTQLSLFQSTNNSFNGDLGHLLGYTGGGGVAASINGLCSSNLDFSQCYSGIESSFQNIPVFSWSVEVVTHEQGHLMGSRHTHACVWNGNFTAIDGCGPSNGYPYEGSCSGAPIPPLGGTIMSYCHLTNVGIDFTQGFGPQPTAVILNIYNNASCLTACGNGTFCSSVTGLNVVSVTTATASLDWISNPGATSYHIQYREIGTSTWILDSSATNSITVTGLNPGITYEWKIKTICSSGISSWSVNSIFITVPLVCSNPPTVSITNITSVSANFSWSATQAAIAYIVQFRITGTSIWTEDTVSTNNYHATGLIPNSQYEFQVQTICAGGGTSNFGSQNIFNTLDAGSITTIVLQPGPECGKDVVIGDNVGAGYYNANFGDDPQMAAMEWTAFGSSSSLKSLLEFDLTDIPKGSNIQSAYLSLYWDPTMTNPHHSSLTGSNVATLSMITSPWNEKQVTWNTQPGTSTLNQITLPMSTSETQNYTNIDLTAMVQQWVNDPVTNYGIFFQEVIGTPYRSMIFGSSDHMVESVRPKLEITYIPNKYKCISYQYSNCNGVDATIGNALAIGYDTTNFAETPEMDAMAWTYDGAPSELRSMIYWNLSEIPANAIVDAANIYFFWNPTSQNTGHSTMSGSNSAKLLKITSPWDEYSVTWNTQPSVDTSVYSTLIQSTSQQQDYSIDVTSIVQSWVSNPTSNNGLLFKLDDENHYRSLIFSSSDHADPARHPRIEICYSRPTGISPVMKSELIQVHQDDLLQMAEFRSHDFFKEDTSIKLFSSDGKLVKVVEASNKDRVRINKGLLASGVYIYQVISKENLIRGKIIFR